MKYTQIPSTAFQEIQLNAGILVDAFNPATGVVGNLLGATTGGVNFTDTPEYSDFGEDIDNCPKNMMELKHLDSREVKMSGTFVTLSAATAKRLVGSGDVDPNDDTHIIPRNDILTTDFTTMWWIGDYSDKNTGDNAGFVAIKMMNALNTAGFQIQSTDKGKGQFAFEFTGHYSMAAQTVVPYEIYIQSGARVHVPSISAEAGETVISGAEVADLQSGIVISGDKISGSLSYFDDAETALVTAQGAGNFLVLKFSAADWAAYDSVKAGVTGTTLTEITTVTAKNGVWKITDNTDTFTVQATKDGETVSAVYDLTGLTLEEEEEEGEP